MSGLSGKKQWIPALAFLVLLVLPLYALTVVVVVRSDILSSNGSFTDEQFKAMWTFIASGLATCATVLAAILTKSHNDRSLALQAEADSRRELLDMETSRRLGLETTLGGLKVMSPDGKPSPAVVAGGLATIVHLGHALIAMRVLATALDHKEVDSGTAAWVLGAGLLDDDPAVRDEAASLLGEHGSEFTDDAHRGFFAWPDCLTTRWVTNLSRAASLNVVAGLQDLLLSQDRDWWAADWSWVIITFDEAVLNEPDLDTKLAAASAVALLIDFWDDELMWGVLGSRPTSEARDRARALTEVRGYHVLIDTDAIGKWGTNSDWSKPGSSASTAPSAVTGFDPPDDTGA